MRKNLWYYTKLVSFGLLIWACVAVYFVWRYL